MKKREGWLMVIGSLFLTGLFIFPLWNIQLGAPQYPDPLGLNIYINGIQGQSEFDVQNIDGLNHYIGMKTLPKPEDMWEFRWFPRIVLSMIILGVLIGLLYNFNLLNANWFLIWLVLMSILGTLGIYDFNLWMTDYGTNLDPKAILKLQNPDGTPMSYKPPLFGHRKLLNFDAYSYPRTGAYLMFLGMLLVLAAYWLTRVKKPSTSGIIVALLAFTTFLGSCSPSEEPFYYGKDACSFCKMTIVDKQHATQMVTHKGKIFKYDAMECMINDLALHEPKEIALLRTNHFFIPEVTIDAELAFYLISPNLPSPMGANLTAFSDSASALNAKEEYSGEIYNWNQLRKKFVRQ